MRLIRMSIVSREVLKSVLSASYSGAPPRQDCFTSANEGAKVVGFFHLASLSNQKPSQLICVIIDSVAGDGVGVSTGESLFGETGFFGRVFLSIITLP